MGASLSLSGFRRPRPEPEDPSPEEEPRDAKRVKAAPYVLTVLQSSESVTKVLAYTGAGCVLTTVCTDRRLVAGWRRLPVLSGAACGS